MKRGLMAMIVAVIVVLGGPLGAWADCCAVSEAGCQGKATGTSCGTGGLVCTFVANKCPKTDGKANPGDLCTCSQPDSSLQVNPVSLDFPHPQAKFFQVSNGGGVPLNISMSEFGDTDAFSISLPKKCKKSKSHGAESGSEEEASLSSATFAIPPLGCSKFIVKFKPPRSGDFTEEVQISSDAAEGPQDGSVFLQGSARGRR